MPMTRLALLTALIVALAAGSHAQSLRERMQQGVSKVQQGASEVQKGVAGATGRIEEMSLPERVVQHRVHVRMRGAGHGADVDVQAPRPG